MNKIEVLELLVKSAVPQSPDDIRKNLKTDQPRTSVYSYLLRMFRQKLLDRTDDENGISYSISDRGVSRLKYLQNKEK
jgi:Fe2+ or Zn2+ uptake regulation protein